MPTGWSDKPASHRFGAAVSGAVAWLEANAAAVDALNVYPVPDGDTGSNMVLTLRAGLKAVQASPGDEVTVLAQALAHGSLMGARGNSGVILSQICRGFAEGVAERKGGLDGAGLQAALARATARAYGAVTEPVEGTILTVMRAAAEGAAQAPQDASSLTVLQLAFEHAREALAATPNQLPVLKQAGVVDAGGQGLVLLLEGALAALRGTALGTPLGSLGAIRREWLDTALTTAAEHDGWGYCTQFAVEAPAGGEAALRAGMPADATSMLVVGDAGALHVHLHTQDPGAALSAAVALGTLHNIKVDNMSDQSAALAGRVAAPGVAPAGGGHLPVVAVVPGDGLARVFTSLGAGRIVTGGQSMNPSLQQLAEAAQELPGDTVILLPNNPNVQLVCGRLHEVLPKQVLVVPTDTVVQGIAALMAGQFVREPAELAEAMTEGMGTVRSIEVTIATRSIIIDGIEVTAGQHLALLDRKVVACAPTALAVLHAALDSAGAAAGSLVTLYYGAGVPTITAEETAEALRRRPTPPVVEVVEGGQPHYPYLLSLES